MSEKKKKPERKRRPHRTQTKQWVDPQNTEDAAGQKLTDKKKKENPRHNPWGKDATANPENMSAGSGG